MAFLAEPHTIRNNSSTSMLDKRMLYRDMERCSVLGRRPWCGKRRLSSTPMRTSDTGVPAMQPRPKRSRIEAPKSGHYCMVSQEIHPGNDSMVDRHSRGRKVVTMAEHRNVYHPGRTVSSRDELRDAWLGPVEHRTILRNVARDLIRLKQMQPQKYADDTDEWCWRGLESLHVRESCRPADPPSRLIVRHVVRLYADGQHKAPSSCASAISESHSQLEQLRLWYRSLSQCDRQQAERKARLDRLEVLQDAMSSSHVISGDIPFSFSSC